MTEVNNSIYDTIIIGAGQAGLSAGYFLKKLGKEFIILTKDSRIGNNWRKRWDSLRLFTPVYYNTLPGMDFPSNDPDYLPDKNETADFLEKYALKYNLPVCLNTEVVELEGGEHSFTIQTKSGSYFARNVIVATGSFQNPHIPDFAGAISESIFQIHSSRYLNPGQLREGDVLVVGAGSSGLQIAAEIAEQKDSERCVWLSGPDTGTFPRQILGIDIYHFFALTVFHVPIKSLPGRIIKSVSYRHGDLALRPTYRKMIKAGVIRVGRTIGLKNGLPLLENNISLNVKNIIWCTGFRYNFDWIKLDIFDSKGLPLHNRGIINKLPGIYFLGLHFQYTISSSLLGGVKKDAEYIADYIADNT
jgi:putative flavoprotein involved in K+ transport